MSSAGRAYLVKAAGCGCAAARLICGPDTTPGRETAGLAPGAGVGEEELEPVPAPEPPWPPPPPPWAPLCLATSSASFLVRARIEAGRGRYPAGSCPGWTPGVWPGPAAKSRKRAMAAALACGSPLVGTIA